MTLRHLHNSSAKIAIRVVKNRAHADWSSTCRTLTLQKNWLCPRIVSTSEKERRGHHEKEKKPYPSNSSQQKDHLYHCHSFIAVPLLSFFDRRKQTSNFVGKNKHKQCSISSYPRLRRRHPPRQGRSIHPRHRLLLPPLKRDYEATVQRTIATIMRRPFNP